MLSNKVDARKPTYNLVVAMKKYSSKKHGNKTSVTITLSEVALAWLEMKGRDDMRSRAGFASKIFESLSRGRYIDNGGSSKKLKEILKEEKKKGGMRRTLALALSDKALAWIESEARKDVSPRATFAARVIEQLARGLYAPILSQTGEYKDGRLTDVEKKSVTMVGMAKRLPQANEIAQLFIEFLKGRQSKSGEPWFEERKENRNGKTNRPKN